MSVPGPRNAGASSPRGSSGGVDTGEVRPGQAGANLDAKGCAQGSLPRRVHGATALLKLGDVANGDPGLPWSQMSNPASEAVPAAHFGACRGRSTCGKHPADQCRTRMSESRGLVVWRHTRTAERLSPRSASRPPNVAMPLHDGEPRKRNLERRQRFVPSSERRGIGMRSRRCGLADTIPPVNASRHPVSSSLNSA